MKGKHGTKLHEWQLAAKNNDQTCAKCGRTGFCTLDHIIPQSLIEALGLSREAYDHDWNFQYLCRACNTLKGYRLDFNNPLTIINLKKYVSLAEETYK